MPTGFTAALYEGEDIAFNDFAMRCTRGLAILTVMRDDPLDAPIPDEFEPTSYHVEGLKEAKQRLAEIEAWSDDEAEQAAQSDYERAVDEYKENKVRRDQIKARYEAMLEQVRVWVPPTADHEGLKRFMTEQLEESIKFDCGSEPRLPVRVSGAQYREQELTFVRWDIKYHTEENEREVERARERSAWVRALRESLAQTATTV